MDTTPHAKRIDSCFEQAYKEKLSPKLLVEELCRTMKCWVDYNNQKIKRKDYLYLCYEAIPSETTKDYYTPAVQFSG